MAGETHYPSRCNSPEEVLIHGHLVFGAGGTINVTASDTPGVVWTKTGGSDGEYTATITPRYKNVFAVGHTLFQANAPVADTEWIVDTAYVASTGVMVFNYIVGAIPTNAVDTHFVDYVLVGRRSNASRVSGT